MVMVWLIVPSLRERGGMGPIDWAPSVANFVPHEQAEAVFGQHGNCVWVVREAEGSSRRDVGPAQVTETLAFAMK